MCSNVTTLTIYTSAFYMYYILENTWIRGCWRRSKNHYFYCLVEIWGISTLFLPHLERKDKRREIYFITPKKSLLGLEIQETRWNLTWGWRGKSFVHFCLNAHILHWSNLWGIKGFPLNNNTFQDLTILTTKEVKNSYWFYYLFKLLSVENELWHNLTTNCYILKIELLKNNIVFEINFKFSAYLFPN